MYTCRATRRLQECKYIYATGRREEGFERKTKKSARARGLPSTAYLWGSNVMKFDVVRAKWSFNSINDGGWCIVAPGGGALTELWSTAYVRRKKSNIKFGVHLYLCRNFIVFVY